MKTYTTPLEELAPGRKPTWLNSIHPYWGGQVYAEDIKYPLSVITGKVIASCGNSQYDHDSRSSYAVSGEINSPSCPPRKAHACVDAHERKELERRRSYYAAAFTKKGGE